MRKPELLVTPKSVEDIIPLCAAGADAFVIGEQHFGLRLAGEFLRKDVETAISNAHSLGKKVYVAVNALFHNDRVSELNNYLAFLDAAGADAAIFGDPAVIIAAREAAPNLKLHWSTETTATNWYACNYWGRKGAKRVVLAKEINLDSIIEIKEHAEVEIEVQVHGMTAMFQSKRTLLQNYFFYQGKNIADAKANLHEKMLLHDHDRNNKYPIFEDENGTHIMSPNDVCMIDELQEMIEAGIDAFKIDGILKDSPYIEAVTKLYRKAIDLCVEDPDHYGEEKDRLYSQIEKIQPQGRPLDTGFFFKETVY
ncbi:U32 family peptidase [Bacillaceae bacterium Marseille-Q3522]|nr:U32 family peptidase [Bacillaceae bacterium Marseille-Q3522]